MSAELKPKAKLDDLLPQGDGPIVMVNLLRFKPGGGTVAYARYAEAFSKMLEARGGKFVYRGRVEATLVGDQDWHAVALVEYPSRQTVIDLLESPEYEKIHPWRDEGLERTLLYASRSL